MALLMGKRVSEIADRIVRNLDDDGRLLWIADAAVAGIFGGSGVPVNQQWVSGPLADPP